MATKTFQCRVVTPAGQVLSHQATSAIVPAWDGLLGVLPDRAPLVTTLGTGELTVRCASPSGADSATRTFLVEDGFAQMVNNRLTVLAARAVAVESLVEAQVQAEVSAAEAKVLPADATPAQREALTKERARAQAKLRAVRASRASRGA